MNLKKLNEIIVVFDSVSVELNNLKKEIEIKTSTAIFDFIDNGIEESIDKKDFLKTSYFAEFLNEKYEANVSTTAVGKKLISNGFKPAQKSFGAINQKGYYIFFKNFKDKFDLENFLNEKYVK